MLVSSGGDFCLDLLQRHVIRKTKNMLFLGNLGAQATLVRKKTKTTQLEVVPLIDTHMFSHNVVVGNGQ